MTALRRLGRRPARNRPRRGAALRLLAAPRLVIGALLLVAAGCGGGEEGSIASDFDLNQQRVTERGGGGTTRFVVGSKDFAEQEILGHIALSALKAGGAEVVDRTGLGGTEEVRAALLSEQIDLYWEYTGTGWLIQLAQPMPANPDQLYGQLDDLDRERNGVAWLEPAPADNTYAIAVRGEAEDPDVAAVQTISDLAALIEEQPEKATICVGPEFHDRADGLPGLSEHYGFTFPPQNVAELPDATVYGAVDAGERCNFGSVFATNGQITALDLRLLDDDQGFFAPYHPSVVLRQETLELYPALEELFALISAKLDTQTLRDLSAEVLVDNRPPADVAEEWLEQQGFLSASRP